MPEILVQGTKRRLNFRTPKVCAVCTQTFSIGTSPNQKTCSEVCARKQRSRRRYGTENGKIGRPARRLGSKLLTGGYVLIKVDGGWKSEHRWVMERALGRSLRRGESVHHINGIRSDNRLENLQVRQRFHGDGIALRCLDCGSTHIAPVGLGNQQEPLL
jgi:HNH endonuclease